MKKIDQFMNFSRKLKNCDKKVTVMPIISGAFDKKPKEKN